MKDDLEKFIEKNRQEFDELSPVPDDWSAVSEAIQSNKGHASHLIFWKVAAAVLLILCVGLVLDRQVFKDSETVELAYNQELKEVETYYMQLIQTKRQMLEQDSSLVEFEHAELFEELDQLDLMYGQLKQDLLKHQDDDRLIGAMVENLRMRVKILNKQLEIIERLKNYQKDEIII